MKRTKSKIERLARKVYNNMDYKDVASYVINDLIEKYTYDENLFQSDWKSVFENRG